MRSENEASVIQDAHILIVDDEPMLRETYARVLGRAGYRVSEAANGHDAIAALDSGAFDAILCDITMPGLNGIEMLRAVRERDFDVPVIMNTTIDDAMGEVLDLVLTTADQLVRA